MKIAITLVYTMIVLSGIILIPNAFAENVPDWVKNTAGWWATDAISETEFVNAIEYLIKQNIIQVDVSQTSETSQGVPDWVKNTAGWWATDQIDDNAFLQGIQYLIKEGIIVLTQTEKSVTETILHVSGYPDWLINNPSWIDAREFTNSNFASFDTSYIDQNISKCSECIINVNNHGFRGEDLSKEKPDNTFRIFAVGGSATFGTGVNDNETWPSYIQKKFDEIDLGFEVQIINAGIPNANTSNELQLIKEKIVNFEPDLVIMYDGVNEEGIDGLTISDTIQNWKSVCKLGNEREFKTIIIVQPDSSTVKRIPTINDLILYSIHTNEFLQKPDTLVVRDNLLEYPEKLTELTDCTSTANFTSIFDYFMMPIWLDIEHVNPAGNKIIANKIFEIIMPYVGNLPSNEFKVGFDHNYKPDESDELVVYAVDANLSDKNFENLDLKNAIFYRSDLTGANFANANLKNADFRLANLSDTNFNGANLENTLFHFAKFDGVDISEAGLSEIDLRYTDISGAILANTDLSNKDLTLTNLSGQDISRHDLTNTKLSKSNLSNAKLPNSGLPKNLNYVNLHGVDLSGKDLSMLDFSYSRLDDANLENTNLFAAKFVDVDFTKIKNKSLVGADLSEASFAHSNLSGVNLSGAILTHTNFWNTNLSGVDFTDIGVIDLSANYPDEPPFIVELHDASFIDANLSDSNFEGVNLSHQGVYHEVFKNKAHLKNLPEMSLLVEDLWESCCPYILSLEVHGNDLDVYFVLYNDFKDANLENTNFKYADLRFAGFSSADLTNADLSGADLRKAYFGNADLSNANLEGANLQGTVLNNAILTGANLKCINHPICNN